MMCERQASKGSFTLQITAPVSVMLGLGLSLGLKAQVLGLGLAACGLGLVRCGLVNVTG